MSKYEVTLTITSYAKTIIEADNKKFAMELAEELPLDDEAWTIEDDASIKARRICDKKKNSQAKA